MKKLQFKTHNRCLVFLKAIIILTINAFWGNGHLNAQNEFDVIRNNWLQFTDAPNFLYHHLAGEAFDLLKKREDAVSELNSLTEWQQRQNFIKETLLDIVGPFPEKTPLNAKIVRTVKREGYKIEHIIYESQPGFYVTSSMFIPEGIKKKEKTPAIVYCSGHSATGYRSEVYLHVIANLVKKGFIVFAFDPIGQGERLEYYNPETGKSSIPEPNIGEHSYAGCQSFITGSSQARYMIWDGIRAVDYLISRKEVDPLRIGITGRSGGGTQSAYIAAMDERIYAAAPENYLTNFTRLLQTKGPQDAEQNMFNCIQRGIDEPDYLLVRAPKPALMITTTRDMFSIQGSMEAEKEVSRIYKAYGIEDNFSRVEDDAAHASTKKNREAMYAFFQKHLSNPGNPEDEETLPFSPEEVRVTSTGQKSTSLGGETLYSLNLREAEKLTNDLDRSRINLSTHVPRILEMSKKLSGYREPGIIGEPVFTGRNQMEGYAIEKYFVNGEGDYVIPYLILRPDKPNNKALLYLDPLGKEKGVQEGGEAEWFVRNGFTVLVPDLLGTGETGPLTVVYNHPYLQKWFASILIGRSIVGVQAGDVVRLARLLDNENGISEVYGCARKEMAPVLLHAAAFYPDIKRIALLEPYSSYRSIVTNRFYDVGFVYSAVAGALKSYDINDLAASLAPRRLLIAGVTDGNGDHNNIKSFEKDVDVIKKAYHEFNVDTQLDIKPLESIGKFDQLFMEWIK